jgi:hypothetical protein
MRKVIRALAVSVLIFLSISVPGQTTLLEAEQELLSQLLEGRVPLRFLDLELIDLAVKKAGGNVRALYYLPSEGTLTVITDRNSLTLTPDLEITANDRLETPLAGVNVKLSLIDAFSLVSLQTREGILGLYLETAESGPLWHVITESSAYTLGAAFASTVSVSDTRSALNTVSEKIKKEKAKAEKPGQPEEPGQSDQPGKPDEPGRPDDPGKSDDTPGKGNGKK